MARATGSLGEDDGAGGLAPERPRANGPNWLGWGLALVILLGCVFFIDLRQLGASLRALELRQIAMLILISTADRLLMGYKWGLLLRIAGHATPIRQLYPIFYQANFTGSFMPSHVGGDVLRAWWVMRTERDRPSGGGVAAGRADSRAGLGRELGRSRRGRIRDRPGTGASLALDSARRSWPGLSPTCCSPACSADGCMHSCWATSAASCICNR